MTDQQLNQEIYRQLCHHGDQIAAYLTIPGVTEDTELTAAEIQKLIAQPKKCYTFGKTTTIRLLPSEQTDQYDQETAPDYGIITIKADTYRCTLAASHVFLMAVKFEQMLRLGNRRHKFQIYAA